MSIASILRLHPGFPGVPTNVHAADGATSLTVQFTKCVLPACWEAAAVVRRDAWHGGSLRASHAAALVHVLGTMLPTHTIT